MLDKMSTEEQCGQIDSFKANNNNCRYSSNHHNHHHGNHVDNVDANMEMAAKYIKIYEEKMVDHIYLVPHTPPTLFEMKIKHGQVKNDIQKMFEKHLIQMDTKDEMIRFFQQHLEHGIGLAYNSIIELATKEYRMCQTGFIIGWKDGDSKASKTTTDTDTKNRMPIDDRF